MDPKPTARPAPAPTPDTSFPAGNTLSSGGSFAGHPAAPGPVPPEHANHPDYEIVRELGRGGMGVVYLARHRLMDRLDVLKVMNKALTEKPGAMERFLKEVQAAAKLRHANIATAYSTLRLGDSLAFAMEYVEGEDLHKLVKAKGPLPVQHACYYVQQAAQGLQHAHEKGMAHRDIKPHNLMLSREGKKHTVKILDFGLAKVTSGGGSDDPGLTREGQMLGTPDYVSPEQIADAAKADIRADVYSLGCTLSFLLTGRAPFQSDSLFGLLWKHQSEPPPVASRVRPDVPPELDAVMARMMAKNPADRYQTPADVARALAPFVRPGALPPPPPQPAAYPQPMYVEVPTVPTAAPYGGPPVPPGSMTAPMYPPPEPPQVWASVSPFSVDEPPPPRPRRRPPAGNPNPLLWLGVGFGLMTLLLLGVAGLWASGVFKLKTQNGTLVIENIPADADVTVDGEKVTVTRNGEELTLEAVKEGTHSVKVTRGGTEIFAQDVKVTIGGEPVRVRVIPHPIADPQPLPEPEPAREPEPDPTAVTVSEELLTNGDCSDPTLRGWQIVRGKWFQKRQGVARTCFCAGNTKEGVLQQDVDVSRFAADIDGGRVRFKVSGSLSSFDADRAQFRAVFLDKDKATLAAGFDSGERVNRQRWTTYEGTSSAPPGTRFVRVVLRSVMSPRAGNQENSGYFDDISLKAHLPRAANTAGFVPLFNGKDLTGWEPFAGGQAQWTVEDGEIVGRGGRGVLMSRRGDYGDFHLRVEAKISDRGNGGVLFRQPYSSDYKAGYEAQIEANGIDAYKTGSLYGLVKQATAPHAADAWFTMDIRAEGNRVRIGVNGTDTVDYTNPNPRFDKGYIGLQQWHEGGWIRFRKIEIKELTPAGVARYTPLFNGTDLSGWAADGADRWRVEAGEVGNEAGSGPPGGFLLSPKDYTNFRARGEVKLAPGAKSGFVFRAVPGERIRNTPYQMKVQLIADGGPGAAATPTGSLLWANDGTTYRSPDRLLPGFAADRWHEFEVEVVGQQVRAVVGGTEVLKCDLDKYLADPRAVAAVTRRTGRVGLQSHTGLVRFRNLEIQELKADGTPVAAR